VTEIELHEALASALCAMASKMPYCPDNDAQMHLRYLQDRFGADEVRRVSGIGTWFEMMDRAIGVRAAAEESALTIKGGF